MAPLLPISPNARRLLAEPPPIGAGRHHWLFRVAACLNACGWKVDALRRFLHEGCRRMGWNDRAGRTIDDILAKLDGSPPPAPAERLPPWPEPVPAKRQSLYRTRPLFDPEGDTQLEGADVLPYLYRSGELVCVGWAINHFLTVPREAAVRLAHNAQFVVADPMTAETAPNGSKRCKLNATPPAERRYAVIEFDTGETRTQQAAVLSALHTPDTPLALAVWSAGKSVHAWYYVAPLTPHQKLQFYRYAVYLGADEKLYDTSQLVRMPGGRRNGRKQTILYFEPEHL